MPESIETPAIPEPNVYAGPKIVELGVASVLTGGSGDRVSDSGAGMFNP